VEAVLDLVEQVPPGRVVSYGAVAELLRDRFGRGSARRVGTIMAQYGSAVPWHRVVTGSGRLPPGHEATARGRLEAEGVTFRGSHVDMAAHAWPDPTPQDHPERRVHRDPPKKPARQDRGDHERKPLSRRRP